MFLERQDEDEKLSRMRRQISSELSPKFTEKQVSGAKASRFGRKKPQKETKQDAHTIPTEETRLISKHSPKRPKQKGDVELNNEDEKLINLVETGKEASDLSDKRPVTSKSLSKPNLIEQIQDCTNSDVINCERIKNVVDLKNAAVSSRSFEEDFNKENNSDDGSDLSSGEPCKRYFSDSDSALGSATSSNGVKVSTDDFFAGQIVWGSFSKSTWFPCMIYPYDDMGKVVIGMSE